MAKQVIVYYVSGHGYGHSIRSAEIMAQLLELIPDCLVHIRTSAPSWLFAGLPSGSVEVAPIEFDSGVVEENAALTINPGATIDRAAAFLRDSRSIVSSEVAFTRQSGVSLIVTDIPYLTGEVAAAAGVPAMAVCNFTWDWIYEPYCRRRNPCSGFLDRIRDGYGRIATCLRLPFSHTFHTFPEVVDVPLVARRSAREHTEILREVGLDAQDTRPRVLIGMRDSVSHSALLGIAHNCDEFVFVVPEPMTGVLCENIRTVPVGRMLSFVDLLTVCDIVVCKLGYGILADCISCKTALLFPPREGFREDEILHPEANRWARTLEITQHDFRRGNWNSYLRNVIAMPLPREEPRLDGARVCAQSIASRLQGG
jgi:hypothetical protein